MVTVSQFYRNSTSNSSHDEDKVSLQSIPLIACYIFLHSFEKGKEPQTEPAEELIPSSTWPLTVMDVGVNFLYPWLFWLATVSQFYRNGTSNSSPDVDKVSLQTIPLIVCYIFLHSFEKGKEPQTEPVEELIPSSTWPLTVIDVGLNFLFRLVDNALLQS